MPKTLRVGKTLILKIMAKKLSEILAELSEKAKQLETNFETAKAKSEADIEQWGNQVKDYVAKENEAFDEITNSWEDDLKSGWESVKNSWDDGVSKMKAKAHEVGSEINASYASLHADALEKYAEMTASMALKALVNASDAIVDAIVARNKADKLNNA